jgi:hypothetical protein
LCATLAAAHDEQSSRAPDFLADVVEHPTKCPQCGATTARCGRASTVSCARASKPKARVAPAFESILLEAT